MTLTDLDLIRRERAERSLSTFIQQAWQVLEPATPYSHNWHIDAICEHLEAVNRHEIRNLIINISPRCMKSLTVAVFWPVWTWINSPQERWLFATYGQSLTVRDSIKRRNLITSPWYQDRWGDRFQLTRDQNAKVRFENDRTGFMLATSVDGAATGEGGSKLVLDDPLKASDALSELSRTSVNRWWDQTMSTRLNDRKTGARVIIMQRLHEADLVGHLLDKMADGGTEYEHLMLPMEFEPERRCFTSLGFQDPRQEKGELMWPERFDQDSCPGIEAGLGQLRSGGSVAAASCTGRRRPLQGSLVALLDPLRCRRGNLWAAPHRATRRLAPLVRRAALAPCAPHAADAVVGLCVQGQTDVRLRGGAGSGRGLSPHLRDGSGTRQDGHCTDHPGRLSSYRTSTPKRTPS